MRILTYEEACKMLREKLLKGFTAVCIGSELRSDDRVAIELCRRLKINKALKILMCEYGLENCLGEIIENGIRKILLIDAAIAEGLNPTSIIELQIDEIQKYIPYSTHSLPLPLVLKFLVEELKELELTIIGIVVSKVDIGLEMSPSIENLISSLVNCING